MSADDETTVERTHEAPLRVHATMEAAVEELKSQPSGTVMTTEPTYVPEDAEKVIDAPTLEIGTAIIISPVDGTHFAWQSTVSDPMDAVKPSTTTWDREGYELLRVIGIVQT